MVISLLYIIFSFNRCDKVAYIDTEGTFMSCALVSRVYNFFHVGTFRPDRVRSIADRFGVDGNMALENILYGKSF